MSDTQPAVTLIAQMWAQYVRKFPANVSGRHQLIELMRTVYFNGAAALLKEQRRLLRTDGQHPPDDPQEGEIWLRRFASTYIRANSEWESELDAALAVMRI
jgi:hypothetical protein